PHSDMAGKGSHNLAAAQMANRDRKANGVPPDKQRHYAHPIEPKVVLESPLLFVRDPYKSKVCHVLDTFGAPYDSERPVKFLLRHTPISCALLTSHAERSLRRGGMSSWI